MEPESSAGLKLEVNVIFDIAMLQAVLLVGGWVKKLKLERNRLLAII